LSFSSGLYFIIKTFITLAKLLAKIKDHSQKYCKLAKSVIYVVKLGTDVTHEFPNKSPRVVKKKSQIYT